MTLEVSESGVVLVGDVFGDLKQLIISWFTDDDSEDTQDQTNDESDDSATTTEAAEQNPPDLGISVEDASQAGEHFGP